MLHHNVSDTSQAENNAGATVNYKVKVDDTLSEVNCRKEPSTSGAKVTAYANGTVLNIIKENNGWLYANDTGWVSREYLEKV